MAKRIKTLARERRRATYKALWASLKYEDRWWFNYYERRLLRKLESYRHTAEPGDVLLNHQPRIRFHGLITLPPARGNHDAF